MPGEVRAGWNRAAGSGLESKVLVEFSRLPLLLYVERVIGTIRHECLDHVIIFNEAALYRQIKLFTAYYHESRTHRSIAKDSPESRAVQPPEQGRIVAVPQVGGLHHRYDRRAAKHGGGP